MTFLEMGLYQDLLEIIFLHIVPYYLLFMITMFPPLSEGFIVNECSFFKDCRAVRSLLVRLLLGKCTFNLRIPAVVDDTKTARLGLLEKEGNLCDFILNLGVWDGDGVTLSICSSNRVSISIVPIRSLGSCSSNKVRRSLKASSDFFGIFSNRVRFLGIQTLIVKFSLKEVKIFNRFKGI